MRNTVTPVISRCTAARTVGVGSDDLQAKVEALTMIALLTRFGRWVPWLARTRYRPELYYMRGPGPATLRKRR